MDVALFPDGCLERISAFAGTEFAGLWLYCCSQSCADQLYQVRATSLWILLEDEYRHKRQTRPVSSVR